MYPADLKRFHLPRTIRKQPSALHNKLKVTLDLKTHLNLESGPSVLLFGWHQRRCSKLSWWFRLIVSGLSLMGNRENVCKNRLRSVGEPRIACQNLLQTIENCEYLETGNLEFNCPSSTTNPKIFFWREQVYSDLRFQGIYFNSKTCGLKKIRKTIHFLWFLMIFGDRKSGF